MLAPDLWAQNKGRPARLESLFPFSSGKTRTLFKKPKRTNIVKTEVISTDAAGPDGDPHTCWARKTMQRSPSSMVGHTPCSRDAGEELGPLPRPL